MYRETHTWVRTLRSSGAGAISSARFYKHSIPKGLELCANNLTRKKNMNPRLAGRPQACYFGTSNHSVASGGNETIAEYCWPCRGISSATRLSI